MKVLRRITELTIDDLTPSPVWEYTSENEYRDEAIATMEFTPDDKVRAIRELTDAFFENVLYDEEPIFVGDEATILDVSLLPPEELVRRCAMYYKTSISPKHLR